MRVWIAIGAAFAAAVFAAALASAGAPPAGVFAGVLVAATVVILAVALLMPASEQDASTMPVRGDGPAGGALDMLERMPLAGLLVGERGRVVHVNAAATELISRLARGQHISIAIRAPRFIDTLEAVLATRDTRSVAFTLPGKAGAELKLMAHLSYLPARRDLVEEPLVIVQIEDQTEQLRAIALRSDFIANASHELRTPLASIIGYIETLRGHAKDDPDARAHFLGIMDRQAYRMKRLVDDLMSLSRIEMFEHLRPEEEVDLADLVRETAAGMEPIALELGASLTVNLAKDTPLRVRADRDQIMQVVSNLIDNAVKYGGAGVRVDVRNALADDRHPGSIGVTVADDGPGISREHIPRLTERFYRISTKRSHELAGTGLGLAIVKHILNRHGGALEVASEAGCGSAFTMWLPAQDLQRSDGPPRETPGVSPFDPVK